MDSDGRSFLNLLSVLKTGYAKMSVTHITLLFTVLALLLLLGGYFASAETAYASVSKTKIKTLADAKDTKAKKAMYILDNFDKALITLLIGNNICHIAFSSIATLMAQRAFQNISVTASTLVTTVVVFFVSEMLPKSYAKSNCEKVSLSYAPSLRFFMYLLTPLSFLFSKLSSLLGKVISKNSQPTVTEEELQDIIDTMDEEGSFESDDKSELLHNAMGFDDLTAGDILTSRVDLDSIDINLEIEDILQIIKTTNHSRLPVYNKTIDNIVGVLRTKRFLKAYIKNNGKVDLRSLLSRAYFVPNTMKIDDVFEKMTQNKCYLSIVTDEYGGTMGIVTIEDIVEEIVGDIWDESDEVVESIKKINDNKYIVKSDVSIGDFLYEADIDEEFDDPKTERKSFGMWCGEMLESIPKENDSFTFGRLKVTVNKTEHNRVLSVTVDVDRQDKDGEEDE